MSDNGTTGFSAKLAQRLRKGAQAQVPLLAPFDMLSLDKQMIMQRELGRSLIGGSFADVKFYAFSRRRSTGVIDKPLPVHANSALVRASSAYFEGFFNAEFTEAKSTSLLSGFPNDKQDFTAEYGYDSDSDLEDEDVSGENRGDDGKATQRDELAKTSANRLDADEAESPSTDLTLLAGGPHGQVIVLRDVAFSTCKALMFYIYTGKVRFARLRSQSVLPAAKASGANLAPLCSPKSMYRLADKFGFDELKKIAKNDILAKLYADNIIAELRSSLTSSYDAIRDMEVKLACQAQYFPVVLAGTPQWIADLATGTIPHTARVLTALTTMAMKPPLPPPSPAPPAPQVDPILTQTMCATCRTASLNVTQQIWRYCSRCSTYRNPQVPV
ncbi:hypothetical protein BDW22DRAFT_707512 [Trametopsis cervina]|nr:hypothetical protein BDW22DRAFT_707512 [Trametopsis cervina]